MWDKPVLTHSSNLVSLPALAAELLGGVLAAFFGQGTLAAVLLLIFLLAGAARLWGRLALRQVKVRVTGGSRCLFPDQETTLELEVQNDKFFPLVWLELFFPLDERLCLVPERSRRPDDWEAASLRDQKANTERVGGMRLRPLLWYETTRVSCRWTAQRRGVYDADGWRLRTGDGFGLTCRERALLRPGDGRFVVYPRLTAVSPELFLRNLWNAETGAHGVMEDPTVIRSTRDYLTTDSPRQINWRLLARGLPLTVNVYESILPRSVHFLLDGESFSGPDPHPEALEETLSILASELVRLDQARVRCGLSLCKGKGSPAVTLPATTSAVEELLCALAAYDPLPDKLDEAGKVVPQAARFDTGPLLEAGHSVGRYYYIAYDTAALPGQTLLHHLDHTCLSLLTYQETAPYGEFETVPLCHLKEENAHG